MESCLDGSKDKEMVGDFSDISRRQRELREKEEQLARREKEIEEMFLASSEKLELERRRIEENEKEYKHDEASRVESVAAQTDHIEQLDHKRMQVLMYIEEKQREMLSEHERMAPIGASCSEDSIPHGLAGRGQAAARKPRSISESNPEHLVSTDSRDRLGMSGSSPGSSQGGVRPKIMSPSKTLTDKARQASQQRRLGKRTSSVAEQVTARLYTPPQVRKTEHSGRQTKPKQSQPQPGQPLYTRSKSAPVLSVGRGRGSRDVGIGPGSSVRLRSSSPRLRLSSSSLASVPESMDESEDSFPPRASPDRMWTPPLTSSSPMGKLDSGAETTPSGRWSENFSGDIVHQLASKELEADGDGSISFGADRSDIEFIDSEDASESAYSMSKDSKKPYSARFKDGSMSSEQDPDAAVGEDRRCSPDGEVEGSKSAEPTPGQASGSQAPKSSISRGSSSTFQNTSAPIAARVRSSSPGRHSSSRERDQKQSRGSDTKSRGRGETRSGHIQKAGVGRMERSGSRESPGSRSSSIGQGSPATASRDRMRSSSSGSSHSVGRSRESSPIKPGQTTPDVRPQSGNREGKGKSPGGKSPQTSPRLSTSAGSKGGKRPVPHRDTPIVKGEAMLSKPKKVRKGSGDIPVEIYLPVGSGGGGGGTSLGIGDSGEVYDPFHPHTDASHELFARSLRASSHSSDKSDETSVIDDGTKIIHKHARKSASTSHEAQEGHNKASVALTTAVVHLEPSRGKQGQIARVSDSQFLDDDIDMAAPTVDVLDSRRPESDPDMFSDDSLSAEHPEAESETALSGVPMDTYTDISVDKLKSHYIQSLQDSERHDKHFSDDSLDGEAMDHAGYDGDHSQTPSTTHSVVQSMEAEVLPPSESDQSYVLSPPVAGNDIMTGLTADRPEHGKIKPEFYISGPRQEAVDPGHQQRLGDGYVLEQTHGGSTIYPPDPVRGLFAPEQHVKESSSVGTVEFPADQLDHPADRKEENSHG